MRISDWSSDVCSSDLGRSRRRTDRLHRAARPRADARRGRRYGGISGPRGCDRNSRRCGRCEGAGMKDRFERPKQPWTPAEVQQLHMLAKKGMALKAIAKALPRTEVTTKGRATHAGL